MSVWNNRIAAEKALRALGRSLEELPLPMIYPLIPIALERYAMRVAKGEHYESLMTQFSVTVTAGEFDLNNAQCDTMIFNPARVIIFPPGSARPAESVRRFSTLQFGDLPDDTVWFAQKGSRVVFRNTDKQLNTLAGSLVVHANFIPTIDQLKPEMQGAFLATLCEVITSAQQAQKIYADAVEASEHGRA
jgi:hypothetical protein